jgi:histidinol-phosphate aminotransferase
MRSEPRLTIRGLRAVPHGGFYHEELTALGLKPEDLIDFSVSTNPFMPPEGIREVIAGSAVERYPDSRATELAEKLAERLGAGPENVLVGSGTTELIRAVATTYFRQRDRVLIVGPTYGEYEPAVRLARARPVPYRAREEDDFKPDFNVINGILRELRPRAAFVCQPNNPTGYLHPQEALDGMASAAADALLVLDEAYHSFTEAGRPPRRSEARANVITLRSMTKDYGLPGLRLGYAVAAADIIENLRRSLPPWNVNAPAQAAGLWVLGKDKELAASLKQVREARDFLMREISGLGFRVVPSDANYFLVRAGNGAACRRDLLREGLMVRDCASFGLPAYVRIAPRTLPDCRKLVKALGRLTGDAS